MRVYVPATTTLLARFLDTGSLGPVPLTAFAVTPALREWYVDDDLEELEYAATAEAARASLRLIHADRSALRLRVVVAADVLDRNVEVRDDLDRGVIRIGVPVELQDVASVHVDSPDAADAVALAAKAIDRADLGDRAAQDIVDDAEGYELSWYATQEIGALLTSLASTP